MNILVDENIPRMTVDGLRAAGHDVRDVRGTGDQGVVDELLWQVACRERRLLVTTDKGFAQHRGEPHSGILVVRLRQPTRQKIHDRVMQAIAQFREADWPGMLVVMRDSVQSIWRANRETPD